MSTVMQTAHGPKRSLKVLWGLLFIMQISNRKPDTLLSGTNCYLIWVIMVTLKKSGKGCGGKMAGRTLLFPSSRL